MSFMKSPRAQMAAFALSAVALLLLPLLVQQIGSGWVRIMATALLYVLLALGLNIVVGYAGLLDLGFVAFYAVGAYMVALLTSPHLAEQFAWFAQHFPQGIHWPRCWRRWQVCCWAPRCSSCVATIWPSSPWALAKSSGCS
jgi:ABC-type branched-subunit amino acid transport system permease subunit